MPNRRELRAKESSLLKPFTHPLLTRVSAQTSVEALGLSVSVHASHALVLVGPVGVAVAAQVKAHGVLGAAEGQKDVKPFTPIPAVPGQIFV